ncbi:MAG: small multi-drug export protein [Candidatus Komeilibacteria bacterium]|nr:small multi-drug export protein [Candidatus Komeilibacteria bacterium]
MLQSIIQFFSGWPPELATILMAMTPVGELRLALPVAILGFKMPIWEAYFLAVLGNMIPALAIAAFAGKFHAWVEKRAARWGKDWADYLASVQNKFSGKYQKYGLWGLALFIGVPIPGTGAWTGALAAFIFGIPFKKSWPFILLGIAISGILTLFLTVGADKIFWP